MVTCQLAIPNQEHLFDQIKANAGLAGRMVQHQSHVGKSVVICGAGPSLAEHHVRLVADEIWACNSALPYLVKRNLPVTHGFCVDQGKEMLSESEWGEIFDVQYLLASTVHPELAKRISASRQTAWFHNYCGLKDPEGWAPPPEYEGQTYEHFLYASLYQPAPQVGYGLNSVPRAVCLALWMGFEKIVVLGADCAAKPNGYWMPPQYAPGWEAWLKQCVLYASGRTAFDAFGPNVTMVQKDMESKLGDPSTITRWHTRPDMVISAMHMANLGRAYPNIELVGNTLPNAMMDKPQEWFDAFPQLNATEGVVGFEMSYEEVA